MQRNYCYLIPTTPWSDTQISIQINTSSILLLALDFYAEQEQNWYIQSVSGQKSLLFVENEAGLLSWAMSYKSV